jgi:hypothetical protein
VPIDEFVDAVMPRIAAGELEEAHARALITPDYNGNVGFPTAALLQAHGLPVTKDWRVV